MNAFTLLFACVTASSAQFLGVAHPRVYSPRIVGALPATYTARAPVVVAKTISPISAPYAATTRVVAAPAPLKTFAAPIVAPAPYISAPRVVAAPAPRVVPAPQVAAVAPVAPAAEPVASQFHAQDEFGNVQFGYANVNSQRHEIGNVNTGVQGSYSYVDANNIVQTTNYVADALGFRVKSTNLPVAPIAARKKRSPVPQFIGFPVGLPYAGLPAPTFVPSGPATAEATLTTVQLNPGHAVAYRVD